MPVLNLCTPASTSRSPRVALRCPGSHPFRIARVCTLPRSRYFPEEGRKRNARYRTTNLLSGTAISMFIGVTGDMHTLGVFHCVSRHAPHLTGVLLCVHTGHVHRYIGVYLRSIIIGTSRSAATEVATERLAIPFSTRPCKSKETSEIYSRHK